MMRITVNQIKEVFRRNKYIWNPSYSIIAIRTLPGTPDEFCDFVGYCNDKEVFLAEGATRPGVYYLENPLNNGGTAIIKPGQYRDCYIIGTHRKGTIAEHEAFIQVRPIWIYRDIDKDRAWDINPGSLSRVVSKLNVHRCNKNSVAKVVGKHSAGCNVFRIAADLEKSLGSAKRSGLKRFDLVILESSDLDFLKDLQKTNDQSA